MCLHRAINMDTFEQLVRNYSLFIIKSHMYHETVTAVLIVNAYNLYDFRTACDIV